jgi:hypothetical protein
MSAIGWPIVDCVARLLARNEREAVRGDLAESGESAGEALLEVLGLVIRREAAVWKSWRPWIATFGLTLPGSFLLMGLSLSVSWLVQGFMEGKPAAPLGPAIVWGTYFPLVQVMLLIGWSWTAGFVVGSVSRRTLWASIAASCIPCVFCLARFRIPTLSRFCLLLFLPPGIWGVRQGLRMARVRLGTAIATAVALTLLAVPTLGRRGPTLLNWAVIWPAWYMVATARQAGGEGGRTRNAQSKEERTAE